MGQVDCAETSVRNYHYSLCNNSEECSSHVACLVLLAINAHNLFSYVSSDWHIKISCVCTWEHQSELSFNPLNPELNPICYLLVLLGAHHFLHVSRIRVKLLTFRRLMSYIYEAPILDVSRSHTTTQHSR